MSKELLIFDTEVYKDYFLLAFLNPATGNVRHFELYDGHPLDTETLRKIFSRYRVVSFNGNNFDIPIISQAMRGVNNIGLKKIADRIILNNVRPWALDIEPIKCDHIDIIDVAPSMVSLKMYGGRMHYPKMQDLPIEPDASISPKDREDLKAYCINDLGTTLALYETLKPQIELRELMGKQYGMDLRSRSDAQIAETVIRHEVERQSGRRLPKSDPFHLAGTQFKYNVPDFISYQTAPLNAMLETVRNATFTVASNGVVRMPEEIAKLDITIGNSTYRMGIGGLHSSEKSTAHYAKDGELLIDRDVASYYPAIILNCDLKPESMGEHFTHVYKSLVERRLVAKRNGDRITDSTLKIVINGSFGKFGSPYSALYSPTLLVQTTLTGQLSLLMLIEALEEDGISVVSANTDGLVISCSSRDYDWMDYLVHRWEERTGFTTEESEYQALFSRDVNNYIALKKDGKFKLKGVYAPTGLMKNPANEICIMAVLKHLENGTPIEDTVRNCDDVRRFLTVRTVKGGAVKDGELLGRAIRWYYADGETGTINYKLNGNKVPRSDGAVPLMNLPDELPNNIDYDWYINEANDILKVIGHESDS